MRVPACLWLVATAALPLPVPAFRPPTESSAHRSRGSGGASLNQQHRVLMPAFHVQNRAVERGSPRPFPLFDPRGSLGRLSTCRLLASPVPVVAAVPGTSQAAILSDPWYVWTILLTSSSFGLWSERTQFGAALSSPLVTMLLTLSLCNVGCLPHASPVYTTVNKVMVPLSVPLLLLDADIRRVSKYAGTLLWCFLIGALGTVVGTFAAACLVPLAQAVGADAPKIASALAARHIGGAINYVAVAEATGMSADAVVACLAADNLAVALYFSFLFWRTVSIPKDDPIDLTFEATAKGLMEEQEGHGNAGRDSICHALSLSCLLTFMGTLLSRRLGLTWLGPIPLTTILTVCAATLFPKKVGSLGAAGGVVGCILMQLFFASTGAAGSLAIVLRKAPTLLVFSGAQLVFHFIFLTIVGRLVGLPFKELALASNANVGGPTTAAAMAAIKGWRNLILPALLTGILGYATGTFIGISLMPFLERIMRVITVV